MRKKLNQFANFGKAVNVLVIIAFTLAFVFTAISCADEFYFGKTNPSTLKLIATLESYKEPHHYAEK